MIPDYLPDCLHGFLWLIEPTITLLQLIAYGGLTLCTLVAIIGWHLEDKARGH
ncbi:hypothetical protein F401_gp21 [Aeromonas phage phiAS7]|uniref:Uncharacterized protein n=1 Tax=Aeromonas phage phiAS7 TaxID=1141132 RepID=H6UK28_9CAUD|nr:hypothetical protein F401_gp21 [Aeromonas phage phiAS7]AEZ65046.1 hypothetical protein phiAS7_00021 [Aeromonas phage phiAS7]